MSNTRGYVGTAHDVTAELRHASTCSLPPRMYTAVHVYSCILVGLALTPRLIHLASSIVGGGKPCTREENPAYLIQLYMNTAVHVYSCT